MTLDELSEFSRKYTKKLEKVTYNFNRFFSISHFTHASLTDCGQYYILTSNPDRFQHYSDKNLFLNDILVCTPENYQEGVIIWSSLDEEYQNRVSTEMQRYSKSSSGFSIVMKSEDPKYKYSIFNVSFKAENPAALNTALSQLEIIKKFCNHFLIETSPAVKLLRNNPFDMGKVKGSQFFERKQFYLDRGIQDLARIESQISTLKTKTKAVILVEELNYRERQCIRLYLNGKTARETAELIMLSRRTVEQYLDSARYKLNCQRKQEFFDIFSKS
jgi:DNA-binding CsgD family transcriptional regulator